MGLAKVFRFSRSGGGASSASVPAEYAGATNQSISSTTFLRINFGLTSDGYPRNQSFVAQTEASVFRFNTAGTYLLNLKFIAIGGARDQSGGDAHGRVR